MNVNYVPLFQERMVKEPFWLLVGCALVNRATWSVAERVHKDLRGIAAGPAELLELPEADLVCLMRPLGFQISRAKALRNLAARWVERPPTHWRDVLGIVGCGQYAADSWAIFVDGLTSVRPADKRLREYLREQRRLKAQKARERSGWEEDSRYPL